ncbi:MAG: ferric iron reductase [Gammaproteobacteria bacterium]|uniref:ferric iron reductase n=1 Tax=Pseudomonas mandelii TaxID=75612 RepID=UPI0012B192B4|nr:ferric iron reductase [Pseudomonas mandelii]MBU0523581.1 ferric iron reductase [Gammaproteobacteria bacterium]MBU0844617.1 ferric iron reductase [Gammaproteobacteria bacterium]MBU1843670.1 ferric iron reductase [Gammaproteobacteria bacterium]MSU92832.1 hypothetical protein [Pseudomonas mandelii]
MQHAFAFNLIDNPVPASSPSANTGTYAVAPASSRTCISHEYRVDQKTGEIYGEFITTPFVWIGEQYRDGIPRLPKIRKQNPHLMGAHNSDNVVCVDFRPAPVEPARTDDTANTTQKRGPKPKVRLNPYAAIIKVAVAENAQWIDDAVMAGMYIAVNSSNGKLNIRPGYVRKALTMAVISTEAISCSSAFRNHDLEPVSERYARYLAAAGRVALRNVERYLDTHPAVLQRLEAKVLEPTTWGEEFDLDEADYVDGPYGTAA